MAKITKQAEGEIRALLLKLKTAREMLIESAEALATHGNEESAGLLGFSVGFLDNVIRGGENTIQKIENGEPLKAKPTARPTELRPTQAKGAA